MTVPADAPDWVQVLANNNLLSRDPMPPPVVPGDYADPANLPMSSMNYAWIGEGGTVRVSGVGAARVMAAWEDGHAATSAPDGSLDLPAAYKSADFEPTVYENGEYMKVSVWQARLAAQKGEAGDAGAAWAGDVTEGLGPGEAWSTTTWPVTVVLRSVPKPEDWRSASRPWLRSSLPTATATAKRPFAWCTAESADGGDDDGDGAGDTAGTGVGTPGQAQRVLALHESRDAERRQALAAEQARLAAEQERRREKEAEFQAWNAEQRAQKDRRRCLSY